jgi:hypothetical protein
MCISKQINWIIFLHTSTSMSHNLVHNTSLRPESSESIPILLQEADLDFSNQNDLRNPKMGSKQSVVVATEW